MADCLGIEKAFQVSQSLEELGRMAVAAVVEN